MQTVLRGLIARFLLPSMVMLAVMPAAIQAQNPPDHEPDNEGRTAAETLRRDPSLGRSPGRLVVEGVIAAARVGRGARLGVDVTDTAEDPIEGLLIADAIDILFEQLVTAIRQFETLLRARAGFPPRTASLVTGAAAADANASNNAGSLLSGLLGRKQRSP